MFCNNSNLTEKQFRLFCLSYTGIRMAVSNKKFSLFQSDISWGQSDIQLDVLYDTHKLDKSQSLILKVVMLHNNL